MQTTDDYSPSRSDTISRNDARQGQRIPGMPSVLAISTVIVIAVFGAMLIASIA